MMKVVNEKEALRELESGLVQARKLIRNPDKLEKILEELEAKMKEVP